MSKTFAFSPPPGVKIWKFQKIQDSYAYWKFDRLFYVLLTDAYGRRHRRTHNQHNTNQMTFGT